MPEDEEFLQLGTTTVGLELNAPVSLCAATSAPPFYIIGKTGTGKSTLLYNLMHADLVGGHGFALLTPTATSQPRSPMPLQRGGSSAVLSSTQDPSDLSHPISFKSKSQSPQHPKTFLHPRYLSNVRGPPQTILEKIGAVVLTEVGHPAVATLGL